MEGKARGIQRNPIFYTLTHLRGNQRALLWTEPLFGIPNNLFVPLASVYMAALGMSPFLIGLVTTLSLISQTCAAAIAGVVTDRLGRRRATVFFDFFAWILPSVLWATASGPLSFLLAAFFNGCWRVTETSWGLLLTEDYPPEGIIHLYAITNIAGLVAGFVSPLAYVLVQKLTLVTAMRWMYAGMAVSMVVKNVLIYRFSNETSIGLRRMQENRGVSMLSKLLQSRSVLKDMFRLPHVMLTMGLVACFMVIKSVNDSFLPLLLTEKLGVREENLSLLSMARTLLMLLFYFVLVPRLDVRRFLRPMAAAALLLAAADLSFMALGRPVIGVILINVMLEAAALSVITPLISSLRMQAMEKEQRARMFAFTTMLAMLITAPFGAVNGWLSQIDRMLPMAVNVAVCLLMIALSLRLHRQLQGRDIL